MRAAVAAGAVTKANPAARCRLCVEGAFSPSRPSRLILDKLGSLCTSIASKGASLDSMSTRFRHWAVIVLLALLPATVFAQACELGCALSHQPQPCECFDAIGDA